MIEVRKLESNEWPSNAALRPDQAICVAAIKGEKVVGRIFLVSVIHLEDIFIEEESRNSPVMHCLVNGAESEARKIGLTQLLAFAKDDQMADYIARLGYKPMELSVWTKDLW